MSNETKKDSLDNLSLKEIRENFYRCRDFEISHLWHRSIFLSAFLLILFSGYGFLLIGFLNDGLLSDRILLYDELCCAISLLGIIFSIIWIMMAKGSKAWYEVYEKLICEIENEDELKIPQKYRMGDSNKPWSIDSNIFTTESGKYSLSRLNILIGLVLFIIWMIILTIHYINSVINLISIGIDCLHLSVIILIPVFFCIILTTAICNTWAKSKAL